MNPYRELKSIEDWRQVKNDSERHPVLIIKHSTTCPISARAWREFQSYLDDNDHTDVEHVMVKVIETRDVSNKISAELSIKHESPQAILMQHQQAIWNTSHGGITKETLKRAITTLS
jgi:bacillithiol system protein YtxJ